MREISTDDLSFSGVVNQIDGDKDLGKQLLIEIAKEKNDALIRYAQMERDMKNLRTEIRMYQTGALNVCRHLSLELPLNVIGDNLLVVIKEEEIIIDQNVI